jgi:TMEM175 potassium channel family protein
VSTVTHEPSTGRVEAFSDGVFAIAITLLVLEIRPPEHGEQSLAHGLVDLWPSYLAYTLSFVTIGIMWLNHHEVMRLVRTVDHGLLLLNMLLLLLIAFVPFPTAVLADFLQDGGERGAAAFFYAATFATTAVIYNAFWHYLRRHRVRLLERHVPHAQLAAITRSYLIGPTVYGLAALVALVSAWASLAVCIGLSASYAVPALKWRVRRTRV